MATLYTEQKKNTEKTWALMAIFLAIIVGIGWWLEWYYNDISFLIVAIVISLVMNFISYFYSDKIALKASGAVPADSKQYPQLYKVVENLCISSGMQLPPIYIINDTSPNAFATGRDEKHCAIAFTTGLLQILDRSELEGVAAHELSHIKNRDILLASVVVVLVGIIAIICDVAIRVGFRRNDNNGKAGLVGLVIGLIGLILAPLLAQIIQLAISRKREFLADASGALMTRYPEGLASALQKISNSAVPLKKSSTATAHLFISDPFADNSRLMFNNKGKIEKQISKKQTKTSWFSNLFATHPPVEERVKSLLGQQNN